MAECLLVTEVLAPAQFRIVRLLIALLLTACCGVAETPRLCPPKGLDGGSYSPALECPSRVCRVAEGRGVCVDEDD